MAGLVDSEAVMAEFEDFLVRDGRKSHGTDFLTRKLAELRAKHRVDESSEAAVLRRFGGHLTDTFLGLVPSSATSVPLSSDDPVGASGVMDGGAAISSPQQREVTPCQTLPPSPPAPDSRAARRTRTRTAVPAATC